MHLQPGHRTALIASITLWCVCLPVAVDAGGVVTSPLGEVVLPVPKIQGEPSALLEVRHRPLLRALGWERGFWVVGDEGRAEHVLSLVGRRAGTESASQGDPRWAVHHVRVDAVTPAGAAPKKTDDAEALFRIGSKIYVVGSHFGRKEGRIHRKRQFFARFDESATTWAGGVPRVAMQIASDDFALHRVINDAISVSGLGVIGGAESVRSAFIEASRENYAAKPWVGRIHTGDLPINVEGAALSTAGTDLVWLGLRYPVTSQGEPMLVEVAGIPELFEGRSVLDVRRVLVVKGEGSVDEPRGVRALEPAGEGRLLIVTGNLDSAADRSAILKAHPKGASASSRLVAFAPTQGSAGVETRRTFTGIADVEGVSVSRAGPVDFVRDRPEEIHLLLDPPAGSP